MWFGSRPLVAIGKGGNVIVDQKHLRGEIAVWRAGPGRAEPGDEEVRR